MTTRIDWQHELDSSFGRAPDRPTTDYVSSGHRAVRRRRAVVGTAGLALVAVLGGVGWAALPDAPDASPLVATDPGPAPSADATAVDEPAPLADSPDDVREAEPGEVEDFEMPDALAVTALGNGELLHKPGWRVDDLEVLVDRDGKRAWGIDMSPDDGGEGQWVVLTWNPPGVAATWDPPGKRFATFDEWLRATWAEQRGDEPPPPVHVEDGRVVPEHGVTVLEEVTAPAEAAAYGPVEEQAAARIRLSDGTVLFVLANPEGGTILDPAVLDSPTMEAFLAHLQEQADSGEGLR